MQEKKPFYISTTIPYVNADPHIGFALELVQADVIARYQRLSGRDVFFSTGTDEYGQKIWEGSVKEGKDVLSYVDFYAQKFLDLKEILNLSIDNFIRTTSEGHTAAAQEFWHRSDKADDIYKKMYRGLYCVGCERFLTEKDLMNGLCTLHPNLKPEIVEEENYFFRLGKYKKELLAYLSKDNVILPEWRREEAIGFVQNALEDFSISRNKVRVSWGIPIPGDDSQVMYVWFGAFVNYLSTLGWPNDVKNFQKFWQDGEKVQSAGKDMVKFQSVMWQGMLLSAKLPTTDTIVYHGFITGEGGIKMSKSLGNVINPADIVSVYGTDALRYFLLREISSFEDSPFTMERFKDAYNANLANGLGNLVSRILTMAQNYGVTLPRTGIPKEIPKIENINIKDYMDGIWNRIGALDKKIQEREPYKLFKTDEKMAREVITELITELYLIAQLLAPVLPATSEIIMKLIKENKKPETPLFPRKD